MSNDTSNMTVLLSQIDKNIKRAEARLEQLKQQRAAVLTIMAPPVKK